MDKEFHKSLPHVGVQPNPCFWKMLPDMWIANQRNVLKIHQRWLIFLQKPLSIFCGIICKKHCQWWGRRGHRRESIASVAPRTLDFTAEWGLEFTLLINALVFWRRNLSSGQWIQFIKTTWTVTPELKISFHSTLFQWSITEKLRV